MRSKFILLSLLAILAAGQTALAETVTFTFSGNTEQTGNVNLTITASGSATGSASTMWAYDSTHSISNITLAGFSFSFASDKNSSMAVSNGLAIEANGNTGGRITLENNSSYLYHITIKNNHGDVLREGWNLTRNYSYLFKTAEIKTIVVEYATSVPFADAEISGVSDSYPMSNAAVAPVPTVTWHGSTLEKNTHYTLSYQNNTAPGTATVTATSKGVFNGTSVSKNYTLVWATYTVHFNKNSSVASGSMSDQAFYYTEEKPLTANAFTRTGYSFDGWSSTANGEVVYADGQSVSNLSATDGAIVNLYAQWTANDYTVTLDNQGATTAGSTEVAATFDSSMPAITVPAKTDCRFCGYYAEPNGGGTKYYNADGTSAHTWDIASATTLYAQWVPSFVKFIDENGFEQTCNDFTIIQSSTGGQNLGDCNNAEAWYAVIGNVTILGTLEFEDQSAHLILCDGSTLTITTDSDCGILDGAYNEDFIIYGQSGGTGTISVTGKTYGISGRYVTINGGNIHAAGNNYGICTGKLTINGGIVSADGDECIVGYGNGGVTINGGIVTATTGSRGIVAGNGSIIINGGNVAAAGSIRGISANTGSVQIVGGNVTATGGGDDMNESGIYASSTISLNWTNISDSITASSYNRNPQIPFQSFIDNDGNPYSGQPSAYKLKGKTLRPYLLPSAANAFTLTQGTMDGVTAWWGTLCNTQNCVLSEGAAAYTLGSDYKLYRLGSDGRTIPKNTAVVIIASEATIQTYGIGSKDLLVTDHAPGGNILKGSKSAVDVSGLSGTPYVLSVDGGVIGFRQYTGTEIPANKAYYVQ